MNNIKIGDMVYDCEAEGNLIGWVAERNYTAIDWWSIHWNDGSVVQAHKVTVRALKKEYKKLQRRVDSRNKVM